MQNPGHKKNASIMKNTKGKVIADGFNYSWDQTVRERAQQ